MRCVAVSRCWCYCCCCRNMRDSTLITHIISCCCCCCCCCCPFASFLKTRKISKKPMHITHYTFIVCHAHIHTWYIPWYIRTPCKSLLLCTRHVVSGYYVSRSRQFSRRIAPRAVGSTLPGTTQVQHSQAGLHSSLKGSLTSGCPGAGSTAGVGSPRGGCVSSAEEHT